MTTTFTKFAFWGLFVLIVAAMLLLAMPKIGQAIQNISLPAAQPATMTQAQHDAFVSQLKSNPIADPYNRRWWNHKVNGKQYNRLEKALDDYLADPTDLQAEAELYAALHYAGLNIHDNLADAVHAANHIVNKIPAPKDADVSPANKEDAKEAGGGK